VGFHVVDGQYKPDTAHCRACGRDDTIKCHPGRWPQCWNCNAKLIYMGKTPTAKCVTPSGMINQHGKMIKSSGEIGALGFCAFCGKSIP
jgi:hypothetical protein